MAAIPLSRSALTDEEAVATTAHADILPRRTEKKGSAKLAIPSHALATEKIAHLGDTPLAAVPYATSVAKEAMQEEEVITIAVEKVCIVGASGKLGQYMVQHALDRSYEVVGVCRKESVTKLDAFKGRITVVGGATDDREVIRRAVAGCDAVLVVLVPRGVHGYSSGTAQAVLDHAKRDARLVFCCGWHITRDGQDVYSWRVKALGEVGGG